MSSIENIFDFFSRIPSLQFTVWDFLDICFVTFILYNGIKLIRETRAFQLIKGLLLLVVVYFLVYELNMQTSTYLFRQLFKNLFIIIIILFQQEIRHALEHMGTSFGALLKGNNGLNDKVVASINEITKAVDRMSESKTGALIVMEREVLLGNIIDTGTYIDAEISHELIGNIFYPKSPLHDGAAVIRGGKLCSAGCVLPLTKNPDLSSDLGTRHRAALGLSEECDAVVIVVSEETGAISIAVNGVFTRGINESELREKLLDSFSDTNAKKTFTDIILNKIKDTRKNEKAD